MMKWIKKGKIFDHNTLKLTWFTKNAMVPLPYRFDAKTLRLFVTFCDNENIGRIGFVDLDINNLSKIINYSKTPVIDIGEPGTFDDNGVVTGSLYEENGKLYLFYSGYQLCKKIPYMIFSGAAVSNDNGNTFKKLNNDIPMLDRIPTEKNFRAMPNIICQDNKYKLWYHADSNNRWLTNEAGKMLPVYSTRYLESDKLLEWSGRGKCVFDYKSDDEFGLSISNIWFEDNIYKCIYSIRSLSKGYRLGYAESKDGKSFIRKDKELNLDVTPNSFDSEMMCFAKIININNKTYLFYCGNHYGMDGIGYAELVM